MRILSLVFCAAVAAAGTTPLIAQDTLGREPVSLLQVLDSVAARYPSLEAARARVRAARGSRSTAGTRSEEHTSELQSHSDLVCRLLLEKKKRWISFRRHAN